MLYSGVVGHVRQAVSPSSENSPAAQLLHTMLAEGVHTDAPSQTVPAAHEVELEQAVQGARPVELQVAPATQGSEHVLLTGFQA